MDINRMGPRNIPLDNPAQPADRMAARFQGSAPPKDAGAAAAGGALPPVAQSDLADARKTDQILAQSFGSLVDAAGRQQGATLSDAQRRDLVEFMGSDPLMRGKLLSYLEQIAK
jgi:hypothetical protein